VDSDARGEVRRLWRAASPLCVAGEWRLFFEGEVERVAGAWGPECSSARFFSLSGERIVAVSKEASLEWRDGAWHPASLPPSARLLCADFDGKCIAVCWNGQVSSALRQENGQWHFLAGAGVPQQEPTSLLAHGGALWLATDGGGVARFQEGKWSVFTRRHGLPSLEVDALSVDPDGALWAVTREGICVLEGERWQPRVEADETHDRSFVQGLVWSASVVWMVGVSGSKVLTTNGFEKLSVDVRLEALREAGGQVWGISRAALYRVEDSRCTLVLEARQAPAEIRDVIWTPDGKLWLALENGMTCISAAGNPAAPWVSEPWWNNFLLPCEKAALVESRTPLDTFSRYSAFARLQKSGLLRHLSDEVIRQETRDLLDDGVDDEDALSVLVSELLTRHHGFSVDWKCEEAELSEALQRVARVHGLPVREVTEFPFHISDIPFRIVFHDGSRQYERSAGWQWRIEIVDEWNALLRRHGMAQEFVLAAEDSDRFTFVFAAGESLPFLLALKEPEFVLIKNAT